jgi:cis-3-alkyl-4-acyloxetan-2-one decarboxylase
MREVSERLYPFRGYFLDRGGVRMHYLDEGAGEPVLMVHGNPTWSLYWRRLVQGLADRYRCVVPDHIGCGLSDKPDDSRYRYTLASRIDDLEALVEHLGLERVTLAVHDWGGAIGFGWAVRHPEQVRRLVILNTAAFHLPLGKRVPWQLRLVRDSRLGVFLVRGFNAFARGAAWVGCTRRRMPVEVRDAYCAPYDSWANRIATARFVQDIPLGPGDPAYPVVDEISAGLIRLADRPAIICWGERDFVFDRHFLAEWERRLPAAEVHCFADGGHYVMEDAADEIVPLVRRFLDRHPLTGATT